MPKRETIRTGNPTLLNKIFLRVQQILSCIFSTIALFFITTSTATNNDDRPVSNTVKKIGKGQCGTVWALTGTNQVLKAANENKDDQLYNDYCKHARVEEALRQTSSILRRSINLPSLDTWIGSGNEDFWSKHRTEFPYPESFVQLKSSFTSGRIFPVQEAIRSALVENFAPKSIKQRKESFLSQPEHKGCLIRIYLGRRQQRPPNKTFRLRNFDMAIDEMELLQLDTVLYAETIAQTLAIIHWRAKLDANDVEFVLGNTPAQKIPHTAAELEATNRFGMENLASELHLKRGSMGIWLLDFDQCSDFPEDEQGVKQLKQAFYFNDPYYPRPCSTHPKDIVLWNTFKESYLATSACFTTSDMPQKFVDAAEAEGKKRSQGGSMFQ
ncbi:hypothetical protein LTR84_001713 [Exophiala bonariae]|uniref:DUF3669 domain-containing protein n=1 Tax=Exophiala bonariae TaxID=1690606 RepID=A0AAV9NFT8_9EURO|nr:hypothetical protein LTR84_001713 [Exophiala bonariae]